MGRPVLKVVFRAIERLTGSQGCEVMQRLKAVDGAAHAHAIVE